MNRATRGPGAQEEPGSVFMDPVFPRTKGKTSPFFPSDAPGPIKMEIGLSETF